MKNNLRIIYMPRIAAEMREMGFKLVKVSPNYKKPQYDVYWFEDDPTFNEALRKITKKIN